MSGVAHVGHLGDASATLGRPPSNNLHGRKTIGRKLDVSPQDVLPALRHIDIESLPDADEASAIEPGPVPRTCANDAPTAAATASSPCRLRSGGTPGMLDDHRAIRDRGNSRARRRRERWGLADVARSRQDKAQDQGRWDHENTRRPCLPP